MTTKQFIRVLQKDTMTYYNIVNEEKCYKTITLLLYKNNLNFRLARIPNKFKDDKIVLYYIKKLVGYSEVLMDIIKERKEI